MRVQHVNGKFNFSVFDASTLSFLDFLSAQNMVRFIGGKICMETRRYEGVHFGVVVVELIVNAEE